MGMGIIWALKNAQTAKKRAVGCSDAGIAGLVAYSAARIASLVPTSASLFIALRCTGLFLISDTILTRV
jgi:hypothetical protein